MNRVEVFMVEYFSEIEEYVNNYCEKHKLNPISVSTAFVHGSWVLSLVVEEVAELEE